MTKDLAGSGWVPFHRQLQRHLPTRQTSTSEDMPLTSFQLIGKTKARTHSTLAPNWTWRLTVSQKPTRGFECSKRLWIHKALVRNKICAHRLLWHHGKARGPHLIPTAHQNLMVHENRCCWLRVLCVKNWFTDCSRKATVSSKKNVENDSLVLRKR